MGKSVDGRKGKSRHNFGQQNRGSKSPFKESPMETCAPGEGYGNRPKGPTLKGGQQNQSGGGKPSDTVDTADRRDVARHSGRD